MYELFGATLTVWVHCASSDDDGVPASAAEPECTGDDTTLAVPASHVQPAAARFESGVGDRFASAACAWFAVTESMVTRPAASVAAATAASPLRERNGDGMTPPEADGVVPSKVD